MPHAFAEIPVDGHGQKVDRYYFFDGRLLQNDGIMASSGVGHSWVWVPPLVATAQLSSLSLFMVAFELGGNEVGSETLRPWGYEIFRPSHERPLEHLRQGDPSG